MVGIEIADRELRTQQVHRELLSSFTHPGRLYWLPSSGRNPFVVIAESLIDLDSTCYAADTALGEQLARLGARQIAPERALCHFYPEVGSVELARLQVAPVGTLLSPGESATLFIGRRWGIGQRLRLRGPGVSGMVEIRLGGLPADFWAVRESAMRYPLGWDVFLVDGALVIGLPPTTRVEVL